MKPPLDKADASPITFADEVCERFEQACQNAGQTSPLPSLTNYLADIPEAAYSEALRGLLKLEWAYRQQRGEHPSEDEYAVQFPSHKTVVQEVCREMRLADAAIVSDAQDGMDSLREFRLEEEPIFKAYFEMLGEIGRGGMGRVYKAMQKALHREVAIKVTLPNIATERLRREARLLASIKSPFVVTVHDFQMLSNGSAMIVMEWIDGTDLNQYMRERGGPLSEDATLTIMRDVCEGMLAAAQKGIIHRDLKPSNLLIDRHGRAHVVDFGLARGQTSGGDLSHTGFVMGTPHYMAPEQADDPRLVDTRADVYSFGATFYHALTGNPPFHDSSMLSLLLKHKTEKPTAPRAVRPELTERVSDVILRCLAKSPAQRFTDFAEVLKHLQPPPKDPTTSTFSVGAVVMGRWRGGARYYRGRITNIDSARIHIEYDDGDKEWTSADFILAVGSIVNCRWKGGSLCFRGKITDFDANRIHVEYDDGDKEWTSSEFVSLVPHLAVGTRVECRWKRGEKYYPGKITAIEGNRFHIDYDDGGKEWTTSDMIKALN